MGTPPDRRLSREWLAEISWTILFVVAALSAALGYGIGASNTNVVEYIPGPSRVEYVDVPGPARIEYVDVPGPERVVEQLYEIDVVVPVPGPTVVKNICAARKPPQCPVASSIANDLNRYEALNLRELQRK